MTTVHVYPDRDLIDHDSRPANARRFGRMRSAPGGAGNTTRGLTRSLDSGKEGIAMQATRICVVEGCGRSRKYRDYCTLHYGRVRATGAPGPAQLLVERIEGPLSERLWARVHKTPEGCWEYTGHRNDARGGYGRIRADLDNKRRVMGAHQAAWEIANGPIPDGMIVRHKCDNPPCCNPDHLELRSAAANSADMRSRGRSLSGDRNPRAKLTYLEVAAIRRALRADVRLSDLAAKYGVSKSLISLIRDGKVWSA